MNFNTGGSLLLLPSLAMLVSFLCLFLFLVPTLLAQSSNTNASSTRAAARALDARLQDYAYRAFVQPKTGVLYNGVVPSNLTGVQIAAMRLRSGSLRTRGVAMYKEFQIPIGVVEQPYVERLVLVYQNLGNWSLQYYPLQKYTYLAPVLGLLAYDGSDLSAKNLPELDLRAFRGPIKIRFLNVESVPEGSVRKCIWFDLHGLVEFSNLTAPNECSTIHQGHLSIVTESISPPTPPPEREGRGSNSKRIWIIIGSVVGGVALLALLGILVIWARKCKQRKKMQEMEKAADSGEALHMTTVGDTKAPSATVTRTKPTLEDEYVP
ncbi:putative protein binding protein [Hibiscus syriacus]|uniref:Transmembrane protein n=1 Tax=Hibiscus syriacus TaxID=106335 RepID=A0A6A2XLB2_HIBSY|nr:uncharacterized protein LOC120185652 [Hibiscus syriacus]KAE8662796.1 putative protein binding protein [Hibiscus syriacus]